MPLTFKPTHQPIWLLHFYRSQRGDTDAKSIPILENPTEKIVRHALLARFNERRGDRPPTSVEVEDDDGNVIMRGYLSAPDTVTVTRIETVS